MHAFPRQSRTVDDLVLTFQILEIQNFLDFLQRTGSLDVALVGVEKEGDLIGNKLVFQDEVQLALGYSDSHLVATVHYEDDTTDLVALA